MFAIRGFGESLGRVGLPVIEKIGLQKRGRIHIGVIGVGFGSYAALLAVMIALSFVGTWAAKLALERIPERLFRVTFQIILTVLAMRLILNSVASSI